MGEKQPNACGLYDMLGNAEEWVGDSPNAVSLEENVGEAGPLVDPVDRCEGRLGTTSRSVRGG